MYKLPIIRPQDKILGSYDPTPQPERNSGFQAQIQDDTHVSHMQLK